MSYEVTLFCVPRNTVHPSSFTHLHGSIAVAFYTDTESQRPVVLAPSGKEEGTPAEEV